jgi:hypothetical protein
MKEYQPWLYIPAIPLFMSRQDSEFKANLSYVVRTSLKKK